MIRCTPRSSAASASSATSFCSTRSAIASVVPPTSSSCRAWLDEHDAELDDDARAEARDVSAARLRHEERGRAARARKRADDRGGALRRVPRALRRGAPLPRRVRGLVHACADARARARLLHANDLRVRRRGDRRAVVDLRRRSLRRSRGGARRPARRPESASAQASSGCCSRSTASMRPRRGRSTCSS